MPVPPKKLFLWNGPENPFQNLIKTTFGRALVLTNELLLDRAASLVLVVKQASEFCGCSIPFLGNSVSFQDF